MNHCIPPAVNNNPAVNNSYYLYTSVSLPRCLREDPPRNGVATVPTLSPSTTLGQLSKLSVATLVLHLNNYHLVQDGNKAAKVQRLYRHLQSMQDIDNSSSSGSISGSPSEDEHRDDATPGVSVTGSSSTARRSRPQTTRLHSPATSEPPFTKAQQRALTVLVQAEISF